MFDILKIIALSQNRKLVILIDMVDIFAIEEIVTIDVFNQTPF